MFCTKCGEKVDSSSSFCTKCGNKLENYNQGSIIFKRESQFYGVLVQE